ncbi:O-antigen ligase family protein [Rhizobium sp. CFBP 8752]|uniref:O-antigen ligase family protein n=1 Tax=Rhizobium sp. CFBP 8752 TaxID=2775301 RepID=UPI00177EEFA4|nr:O-antigen ligase family protein [Rhizobium sp. CFBP 8752]
MQDRQENLLQKDLSCRSILVLHWSAFALVLLNFGAVQISTLAIYGLASALLLCIAVFVRGIPKAGEPAVKAAIVLALVAFAWVMFQTTPLPEAIFSQPSWRDLAKFQLDASPVISLTPADDWASLLRFLVPVEVFLLGIILCDSDERAIATLKGLAIAGAVVALLSIAQFLIAPNTLLFIAKTAYLDSLTGFFVNRNTAATYFGIVAILNYGILSSHLRCVGVRRILTSLDQGRGLPFDQRKAVRGALSFAILFMVSVTALVLTKSRAGVAASFAALLLMTLLFVFRSSQNKHPVPALRSTGLRSIRVGAFLIAIALTGLFAAGFLSFSGRALLRAEVQGASDGRFCIMPGLGSGVSDHFPFGTGLASFETAFTAYRDPDCGVYTVWNRAHDVYFEAVFALGVAGIFIIAFGLAFVLSCLVRGMAARRRLRYVPESGFAVVLLLLVHSAFDFSIQISGLAIFVAATLAPIVVVCVADPKVGSKNRRNRTIQTSVAGQLPSAASLRDKQLSPA